MHGRTRNVAIRDRETDDALVHLSVGEEEAPTAITAMGASSTLGLGITTLDHVAARWDLDMTPSGTLLDEWLPQDR